MALDETGEGGGVAVAAGAGDAEATASSGASLDLLVSLPVPLAGDRAVEEGAEHAASAHIRRESRLIRQPA